MKLNACNVAPLVLLMALGACTTPPFELFGKGPANIPSGPKVSDLLVNLKCELYQATISGDQITLKSGASFTLQDWLRDIEYVATAAYTLQVTDSEGITPSLSKIFPYKTPMTSLTLSVGGQLSESEDRNILFNTTVDFARLKDTGSSSCGPGGELRGNLKLAEILSMGFLAASENNDFAVNASFQPPDPKTGAVSPINPYQYGVFGTLTDFTITEGVNGGPTYTLIHLKGPNASGSQGLLNFTRIVKDQLNISFVPVCKQPHLYNANPVPKGYPAWAYNLPPCPTTHTDAKGLTVLDEGQRDYRIPAMNAGSNNNVTQYLQNILPQLGQ
jgi:hypothetical protein